MIGLGTIINMGAILVGATIGVLLGHRLPERTRDVVTDGLGLVTLMVAALSAAAILDPDLREVVGSWAVMVVLAAILIGGIAGSLWRIEDRMESLGTRLQRSLASRRQQSMSATVSGASASTPGTSELGVTVDDAQANAKALQFVDGFVTASLVFCIGPLGILGSMSDGMGRGLDQLALKSALDCFASIAFAASLGWGVAASALAVGVYQGFWTLIGWALGDVLAEAQIAALTATGGLLLVGVALRLLRLNTMRVGDLLPALAVAPLLVWGIAAWT